jgi:N-acetylglucosaminyldiphosphoundecaprenol N-acetyl-beta-D-mannosaminyltransferase
VPERLARLMQSRYGINVVGEYSPPFGQLSQKEDDEIVERIHGARPDVIWVGLSTPKQERWMYDHRKILQVPLAVGVGAAFDLNSGNAKQAPRWMREHGLEWFFRLVQEPGRLWRRYLLYGSEFVWNVASELLSLRQFD